MKQQIDQMRKTWLSGGSTLNGWMHVESSYAAEVMAHAGWDSVTVDLQHSFMSLETALQMMQAIALAGCLPLVRCSGNEPYQIQRLLDAGAAGIICPMINDRQECEQFVGACRYSPLGYRSVGPTRAALLYENYVELANEIVIVLAMIETAAGVRHMHDILQVPGLDGVFVGPGDLERSLNAEGDERDVEDVIGEIAEAAAAAGKIAGVWCGSAQIARRRREQGFRLLTVSSDTRLLTAAARQAVQEARAE